jgi:predicted Fe-Mo cluster-binding NifX family protein
VTVVLPIWQSRLSPVLDFAGRFLVVEFNGVQETGRREVLIGESGPAALARSICELSPRVLICGAISQPMEMRLRRSGLRIVSHVCGEVDAVLAAFFGGTLESPEFAMPGCCGKQRGKSCCWRNEQKRSGRSAHPVE